MKWDTITDEQMESNLNKFNEHQTVGLFGDTLPPAPGAKKGGDNGEHVKPKNMAEARAAFDK